MTVDEAMTQLPTLVKAAVEGEQVYVTLPGEHGDRVVLLFPLSPFGTPPRAGFGSARGLIHISDDFDDPLPEFEEYQ